YRAHDPSLDRKVALKMLHGDLSQSARDSEWQARLQREAQAMARLSHPNVVSVYDLGTFECQMFVAMELVTGQTLRKWLREKKCGRDAVLRLFVQAGRGLAGA